MAVTRIDIETFLSFGFQFPVIDVRSEGEYAQAHIPGAVSLPLFNNDERKIVGTIYKQQGKQPAIKIGLALFGKKLVNMVEYVESLFNEFEPETPKTIVIHCWRGGMRSGGVSWLLDLYGFKVYTIVGGYKAFRKWAVKQFEKDYPLKILGGYTGSGKTAILQEMKKQHQVVIDLEELAKHKGSAFGNIDMPSQPTQEMFENLFALELKKAEDKIHSIKKEQFEKVNGARKPDLSNCTDTEVSAFPFPGTSPVNEQPDRYIWLEDESQRIGHVNIPVSFFRKMRNSALYFLDIPFEERLQHILTEYGRCDRRELLDAIYRIQKKLGGLETKMAIRFLMEENLVESFRILLKYYDKQYLKGLNSRESLKDRLTRIECGSVDALQNVTHTFARQTGVHV